MDELQNIQNLIYVIRGQRVMYLITICDDIKGKAT